VSALTSAHSATPAGLLYHQEKAFKFLF